MEGRAALAASLALAGGVAAAAGSFLPWVEFSAGPISERASGISGWEGKATLLASFVVIVAAARVFLGAIDASSRLRASALMGGLAACIVCSYTAITARDQLLDAAQADLPRAVVQDALDTGLLELSMAVGLYVVLVGGALAIIAAAVPVGARRVEPVGVGRGLSEWAAISPEARTLPPDAPSASSEAEPVPPSSASPWVTPPRPDLDPDPPA